MRRPIVVANWKMYTRASDAYILATTIKNAVHSIEGIEIILCPPSLWLSEISDLVKTDGKINVGAQNMFYEPDGPYTGEISPLMIRDVAKYVIIGHSERRFYFNESNLDVNEKVLAALKFGLSPIVCVGEKTKSASIHDAVEQLKEALQHVPKGSFKDIIVAYEPVWAIGTEHTAPLDHSVKAISMIREVIGRDSSILYGGSINNTEVNKFAKSHTIDGVLVGSASLRAGVFIEICKKWAEAKSFKGDVTVE